MEEQLVTLVSREALSRAKLFLAKAKACPASARVDFEAFLEAALMFAHSALLRLEKRITQAPGGKKWWADLLRNASAEFIRIERNWLIHDAPPKIGQRAFVSFTDEETGTTMQNPDVPKLAEGFYYYGDDPTVPPTAFVGTHLTEIERLVVEAKALFG